MNLQPVKTHIGGHSAHCVRCDRKLPLSQLYADWEGEPFKDYYCPPCARVVVEEVAECPSIA